MRRSILLVCTLALFLGCAKREAASGGDKSGSRRSSRPLTIKGSDTMVILIQRMAEVYMQKNPGQSVQVNGGGSGTGIAAFINGTADLAMASRPMKGDEMSSAEKARGSKVVETPIALDALAVFVHQSNPVRALSIKQTSDIYTGKVRNWKDVGGKNAPIILYGRENSSGTYDYFKEHVLNKADFVPSVQTLQGTAAIINAVSKDVNGIGYGGIAYAKDARALGMKKEPASPAVEPSEGTVADGTYPLSRSLFCYSLANAPERVTSFLKWAVTPEAQQLVQDVGYFPIAAQAKKQ